MAIKVGSQKQHVHLLPIGEGCAVVVTRSGRNVTAEQALARFAITKVALDILVGDIVQLPQGKLDTIEALAELKVIERPEVAEAQIGIFATRTRRSDVCQNFYDLQHMVVVSSTQLGSFVVLPEAKMAYRHEKLEAATSIAEFANWASAPHPGLSRWYHKWTNLTPGSLKSEGQELTF